jgi:hypothetical protein
VQRITVLTLLLLSLPWVYAEQHNQAVSAAQGVLDEFMQEFNNRDLAAVARTLNYPHVRFASGTVKVFADAEEFAARPVYKALTASGWHHSSWRARDIVLASPVKVHIATTFERFDQDDKSIGLYPSLYIVTYLNGHWGIQARSSLAP